MVPHRPAPPVAASKTYQEIEQHPQSRKSSDSSTPSPIQEPQSSPQVESLCIHDQDTGAIYEEISDDVVSTKLTKM